MDPTEILSRLGTDNPPTDEELTAARDEFKAQRRSAVEARQSDEAKSLLQAEQVIDEELERREAAQAAEDAELAELAEGLDDDTEDADAETEDEDSAVEEPAVAEEPAVLDLQAVRLASKNSRARIDAEAVPENPYPGVVVRGVGQAASEKLDHSSTTADVASIFAQYARGRNSGRDTLVRLTWDDVFGERSLDNEPLRNHRLIEDVIGAEATQFEAIAAAGGICAPLPADYNIPLIGSRGRPVRDALVRFGADRGGVRYIAAPRPSQDPVDGSVGVWTEANDTSPSSPAEKPCLHIDCTDECTVTVDAITACLTVGNFLARFSGEQWGNALGQLGIAHDRIAEQNLLALIDAGSIDATYAAGTIPGVLGAVDRAVAAIRSRDRLGDGTGFRLIVDGWLRNALRDHFLTQGPYGQTGAPGVADAAIAQWFATRGVTVTYTADDSIFAAQTDGALLDFPSTTTLRLFPEGTWLFLDGGTLDLGTEIVDQALIQDNNRLAFMETFEGAAKRTAPCDAEGDDSLSITVTIDPAEVFGCCPEPTSP